MEYELTENEMKWNMKWYETWNEMEYETKRKYGIIIVKVEVNQQTCGIYWW